METSSSKSNKSSTKAWRDGEAGRDGDSGGGDVLSNIDGEAGLTGMLSIASASS